MLLPRVRREEEVEQMKVREIIPAGKTDVYNMEVDGTHDFVVNGGAVVHNCRYVLMSRPYTPKPRKIAPVNPFDPLNQRTGNTTSNESRIASWAFK